MSRTTILPFHSFLTTVVAQTAGINVVMSCGKGAKGGAELFVACWMRKMDGPDLHVTALVKKLPQYNKVQPVVCGKLYTSFEV